MRIVVFGVGKFYKNRKQKLLDNAEIVAFIDNNCSLWGTIIDGVKVYSPEEVNSIVYDKIILMSVNAYEMKCQLINIGVTKQKIYLYDEFLCYLERGELKIYFNEKNENDCLHTKKILLISTNLGYNGGTLAAIYFAKAIQDKSYQIYIAAPDGDAKFIKEMVNLGVKIILYKNIIYAQYDELFWINSFDIVVINTLQMMKCACKIKKIKKIYWWLHESLVIYDWFIKENSDMKQEDFDGIEIYAVSEPARNNFHRYYPGTKVDILTYGIPDIENKDFLNLKKDKMVFAIIGGVSKIKGHDILLKAINKLTVKEQLKTEFWIIGETFEKSDYYIELQDIMQENSKIRFWGELNRKEMDEIYSYIDVVLNPSRQDTGPIVVTEGMMHSKVCVTTNVTGMAQYIEDGKNGFICNVEDVNSLCKKISWIISHKDELDEIRKNARLTYEKYFTMEKFGERLEKALGLKE